MVAAPTSGTPYPTTAASHEPVSISKRRRLAKVPLTPVEQMLSSTVGAMATSLIVTPFDVVKTRMQVAGMGRGCYQCPGDVFILRNGIMEHVCMVNVAPKGHFCGRIQYNNTYDALRKISRTEGLPALWRGLPPTLLMAVPLTVIYFTAYDQLSDELGRGNPYTPLLAGSTARTASVTVISPIEMIRTKTMGGSGGYSDVWPTVRAAIKTEGIFSLWRGLGATLMRDVPFSAIYWTGYEALKRRYQAQHAGSFGAADVAVPTEVAFAAGATAGSFAATLTLPFDVIKTHQQTQLGRAVAGDTAPPPTAVAVARDIVRQNGYKGLLIGLTPRVAKVAPSCAIMISSYEFCKDYFRNRRLESLT